MKTKRGIGFKQKSNGRANLVDNADKAVIMGTAEAQAQRDQLRIECDRLRNLSQRPEAAKNIRKRSSYENQFRHKSVAAAHCQIRRRLVVEQWVESTFVS